LRGIKTLAVRVQQAQNNAQDIAHFLLRQPMVKKVYYAGLEPNREEMLKNSQLAQDHKTHMGQAKGGGSVISFTTGDVEVSRRIIDNLQIFKLTVSFGSCNSLCEMPATLSHASIPAHERTLPDDLIRLSIGIEDVNDLLEDVQRALTLARTNAPMTARTGSMLPPLENGHSSDSEFIERSPSAKLGITRQTSTMHTSDRTVPEAPSAARARTENGNKRKLVTSPMQDDDLLQEELRLLRKRVEVHDKNRGLALSFISGLAVAGMLAAGYFQFVTRQNLRL